jgi:hypothetical protein
VCHDIWPNPYLVSHSFLCLLLNLAPLSSLHIRIFSTLNANALPPPLPFPQSSTSTISCFLLPPGFNWGFFLAFLIIVIISGFLSILSWFFFTKSPLNAKNSWIREYVWDHFFLRVPFTGRGRRRSIPRSPLLPLPASLLPQNMISLHHCGVLFHLYILIFSCAFFFSFYSISSLFFLRSHSYSQQRTSNWQFKTYLAYVQTVI